MFAMRFVLQLVRCGGNKETVAYCVKRIAYTYAVRFTQVCTAIGLFTPLCISYIRVERVRKTTKLISVAHRLGRQI